jgi:hypothetical protein
VLDLSVLTGHRFDGLGHGSWRVVATGLVGRV